MDDDDEDVIEAEYVPATVEKNRPLPVQLQEAHPPWVRELAFVTWVAANRNASRAVRMLNEQMREQWPTDQPYREVRDRTLRAWAKRDNWDRKADEVIADAFPGLKIRQVALLAHANVDHIHTINDVAAGEYLNHKNQGAVRNMVEAAKIGLAAGGVGAFGTMNNVAPTLKATADANVNFAEMTLQELGRHVRALGSDSKTDDERRRR